MKKQIRKSIFETNSSSMHAITVTSKPGKTEYLKYHSIDFHTGEFGWDHTIYCDTQAKASYLWTAIVHNFIKEYVSGYWEKDKNGKNKNYVSGYIVLDKENPEYIKRRDAIRTACVHAGIEDDDFNIRFEEDFNTEYDGPSDGGYIDHTPGLDFVDALVFNEDRLIRYLFNDASRVTTWNDNEWYVEDEDEIHENLLKKFYRPETDDYAPEYWEESEWMHFDVPEDTEWKYLKGN